MIVRGFSEMGCPFGPYATDSLESLQLRQSGALLNNRFWVLVLVEDMEVRIYKYDFDEERARNALPSPAYWTSNLDPNGELYQML